jgi:hypothetical protein
MHNVGAQSFFRLQCLEEQLLSSASWAMALWLTSSSLMHNVGAQSFFHLQCLEEQLLSSASCAMAADLWLASSSLMHNVGAQSFFAFNVLKNRFGPVHLEQWQQICDWHLMGRKKHPTWKGLALRVIWKLKNSNHSVHCYLWIHALDVQCDLFPPWAFPLCMFASSVGTSRQQLDDDGLYIWEKVGVWIWRVIWLVVWLSLCVYACEVFTFVQLGKSSLFQFTWSFCSTGLS